MPGVLGCCSTTVILEAADLQHVLIWVELSFMSLRLGNILQERWRIFWVQSLVWRTDGMDCKPQCLSSWPSAAFQLLDFKTHVTYFKLGDGWTADVYQFWTLLQTAEDPWEGLVLELATHNLSSVVWILKIETPNFFFLLLVFEKISLNKYKN